MSDPVEVLEDHFGAESRLSMEEVDALRAALRVHAKLTSQIGCNGVVPSRENSAGFESER